MSGWLIIVTGVIYAYVAFEQAMKSNWPMAAAYAGYSFSNIGLWMAVK